MALAELMGYLIGSLGSIGLYTDTDQICGFIKGYILYTVVVKDYLMFGWGKAGEDSQG
jgi:hypothetical protein